VRYLFGPGVVTGAVMPVILARTSSGGTTAWYLTDNLGSVRDIVNTSGTVIDHIVYDSFGNIVTETNATNGDRFKFAGMEWDTAIGQYYDRARWYGAAGGRFLSQDPKGFAAGDADLYRYVLNAPTLATDPTGMELDSSSVAIPLSQVLVTMAAGVEMVKTAVATATAALAAAVPVALMAIGEVGAAAEAVYAVYLVSKLGYYQLQYAMAVMEGAVLEGQLRRARMQVLMQEMSGQMVAGMDAGVMLSEGNGDEHVPVPTDAVTAQWIQEMMRAMLEGDIERAEELRQMVQDMINRQNNPPPRGPQNPSPN